MTTARYPSAFADLQPPFAIASWPYLRLLSAESAFSPSAMPALCAQLSSLAYNPWAETRPLLESFGFSELEYLQQGANAGFCGLIARDGAHHAFIVFRGTSTLKRAGDITWHDYATQARNWATNWAGNFKVPPTPFETDKGRVTDALVHGGFMQATQALLPQVRRWLAFVEKRAAQKPPLLIASLSIAGHSLGGAMAAIAAALLADQLPRKATVFTYGAPYVGNRAFCDYLTQRADVQRYVFRNDLVSNLPLQQQLSYEHPQTTLHPLASTQDATYAGAIAAINAFRQKPILNVIAKLSDHSPMNYMMATSSA